MLPVYGSPQLLLKSLDLFIASVSGKYDSDVEIVVIADIPIDNPFAPVQDYALKNKFIHFRKLYGGYGLGRKLNQCSNEAEGDFLWIIGEDSYSAAASNLDQIIGQLKASQKDLLELKSGIITPSAAPIDREEWLEWTTKDWRSNSVPELFLEFGYRRIISHFSERIFSTSLLQSKNIIRTLAPLYPQLRDIYKEVAEILLMQFGYVDKSWLQSYAHFNCGAGLCGSDINNQDIDQCEIEFEHLLLIYNCNIVTYSLLASSSPESGSIETYRELQLRSINPAIAQSDGTNIQSSDAMWAARIEQQVLPKIALVTPNYNCVDFIAQTINSVLRQNYPNLQYIVVDGASTDGSQKLIEAREAELHGYVTEPDNGHSDAINKGFGLTDGEIMGWINSDDILLPGSLATIARIFSENPEIDWITGRPATIDEHSKNFQLHGMRKFSRAGFMAGNYRWVQQESTFWRRSLWVKAGGELDSSVKYACDLDLWVRFFRHAELYTVDIPFGAFRQRPGQRSIEFNDHYEREVDSIITAERNALPADFRAIFDSILRCYPSQGDKFEKERLVRLLKSTESVEIPVTALVESNRKEVQEIINTKTTRINAEDWKSDLLVADDVRRFKGKHKGQRCFVMGNGPSLNKMDLNKLEGEIVFGCNSIFLLYDRINWRPTYYTCVDSRVLPDRASEIDKMLLDNPDIEAFFPTEVREYTGDFKKTLVRTIIPSGNGRNFTNELRQSHDNLPTSMFSVDANKGLVQPFTVAITMLQLAVYMGFEEIYLIGCDTSYVVPKEVEKEGMTSKGELGLALTSTEDNDPNHFDPTYFGKGRKWHDPQTDKMIEHYGFAKTVANDLNINILNATVGGNLEVFERVIFDDIFLQSYKYIYIQKNKSTFKKKVKNKISDLIRPYPRIHALAVKLVRKFK